MLLAACSGPAPQVQGSGGARPEIAQWTLDTASTEIAADLRTLDGTRPVRLEGAIGVSGGRTAVLDANAARVLYFDHRGALERTVVLPPPRTGARVQAERLMRIAGDTIGAIAFGLAFVLDERGDLVRTIDAAELRPGVPQRIRMVLALLTGGRVVVTLGGRQQQPSPRMERWIDSVTVVIADSGMTIVKEIGRLPAMYLAAGNGAPRQVWFAPHAVVAARDSLLYYGFGSDYRIDAYTGTGRLHQTFVRPWTPVPVTSADMAAFIEGWSRNWMKGTALEVEQRKRDMRADPFHPFVPAFSEFLVASSGDLWVRTPSLPDAQRAGELYHVPLVPSRWTIFDRDGRRIGEATLPALSHPRDVHDRFVLTTESGPDAGIVLRRKLQRAR